MGWRWQLVPSPFSHYPPCKASFRHVKESFKIFFFFVRLMISIARKGAVTSYIVVELCWLWVLWIMWIAYAGVVARYVWWGACDGYGICHEIQAIVVLGFITWFMSTFSYHLVRFRIQFLTFFLSRSYGVLHHPPHIHRHVAHEGPLQHLDQLSARSRLQHSRRRLCPRSALVRDQDGQQWRLAVLCSSRPVRFAPSPVSRHPALSPGVNVVETPLLYLLEQS